MDNLLKEIRRVQRRLVFQRFLGLLGWCWFVAFLVGGAVIAAARFYPLGIIDWQWLAGSLAAGLLAAVGWTFWARTPALQAALEIDHRCGLKERVSSTLAMHRPTARASPGRPWLPTPTPACGGSPCWRSFPFALRGICSCRSCRPWCWWRS